VAPDEQNSIAPMMPDETGRPFLTVVICTCNRAHRLGETLRSLTVASPPLHHQLEILVVANACTDDTDRVVQEYASRLPLRIVVEPEPGLSHARNAGLRVARGDYVLWTDDDVRVHVDWLTAYERAILKWPGTTVFGGAIIPIFEGGPPSWLARTVHLCESAFASRRLTADAPVDPERDGFPYGANFAIALSAQRARPYDVRLGRQRSRWLTGGEELDVIEALLDAGGTARWVPDAIVEHMIGAERQTTAYLRRYFEGHGYVLGLEEGRAAPDSLRPVRDAAFVLQGELAFRFVRAIRPPSVWVPALLRAAIARGKYYGRRAGKPPAR
jgi:glycosyltransferase involved in cell wall biosynthesis